MKKDTRPKHYNDMLKDEKLAYDAGYAVGADKPRESGLVLLNPYPNRGINKRRYNAWNRGMCVGQDDNKTEFNFDSEDYYE